MARLDLKTNKLKQKQSPDGKKGWEVTTLSVIQESNSFGDQLLTFCDHTTGKFRRIEHVEYEGNWQEFTKLNMLKLAKVLLKSA